MSYYDKKLTPKQSLYIAEMASGKNTYQIAFDNNVSEHTVRNTLAKARDRVNSPSTTHVVAIAIVNGWVKPDLKSDPLEFVPNE